MELTRQVRRAKKIKMSLAQKDFSQTELILQLAKNGILTTPSELSGALRGVRRGPKIDIMYDEIEKLLGIRR